MNIDERLEELRGGATSVTNSSPRERAIIAALLRARKVAIDLIDAAARLSSVKEVSPEAFAEAWGAAHLNLEAVAERARASYADNDKQMLSALDLAQIE